MSDEQIEIFEFSQSCMILAYAIKPILQCEESDRVKASVLCVELKEIIKRQDLPGSCLEQIIKILEKNE